MPQGKLKVKAKLPSNVKRKQVGKQKKGPASSKRANCPIAPKKKKFLEENKLKKMISKNVNQVVEDEMRQRAYTSSKSLSKAQQAVVAHHSNLNVKEKPATDSGENKS